jgi:hypothetical protein
MRTIIEKLPQLLEASLSEKDLNLLEVLIKSYDADGVEATKEQIEVLLKEILRVDRY